MTIDNIKKRSEIIKTIRSFFDSREYLEVETPVLSPTLIPESSIEVFETKHVHPYKASQDAYLIPSPEIWLKQIISEHKTNIYEISKCFRNSEQYGSQHNPEFTMIEYYTMNYDHIDTLNLTVELIDFINSKLAYSKLPKEHERLTMEEAFRKYAGFSLKEHYTVSKLHIKAEELGIHYDENDSWETAFNRIFIDKVEPQLPKNVNLFLTSFPNKIKTLSKDLADSPWSQRWELYINGLECGNCYTEENNPEKVKRFFIDESKEKKHSIINHKVDKNYWRIFNDFPSCSGGAIGIDRLIMGILGTNTIQGVILFPTHDNI